MNFVISIFLGLLPEVLYFTLFLVYTKGIKTKRLKLFLLLAIGYIALIMICRYQLLFYLGYIVYTYLILKLLYKSHIVNLFLFVICFLYYAICSYISFIIVDNYWVAYILDRILLFLPIIFINNVNGFYKKYTKLWNRNDKAKIKSITLRNISLMFLYLMIIIVNFILLYIIFRR